MTQIRICLRSAVGGFGEAKIGWSLGGAQLLSVHRGASDGLLGDRL